MKMVAVTSAVAAFNLRWSLIRFLDIHSPAYALSGLGYVCADFDWTHEVARSIALDSGSCEPGKVKARMAAGLFRLQTGRLPRFRSG